MLLCACATVRLTGAMAQAPISGKLVCNGGFKVDAPSFGLATVQGDLRLRFESDEDGCPGSGSSCLTGAYAMPGDRLLTSFDRGQYVCALDLDSAHSGGGWVDRNRLRPLAVPHDPPLGAWVGHWTDGDNVIRLSHLHGTLVVEGNAYWPSAHPPLSQFPGGPNFGSLRGGAVVKCFHLTYAEGSGCEMRASLIGSALVVSDNGRCGGMNVRFDGVYRRR